MSDALTDIARDQKRYEQYEEYIKCFAYWLGERSEENREKLIKAVEACDDVVGGYWSRQPTRIRTNLECHLNDIDNALIETKRQILSRDYKPIFPKEGQ